MCGRITQKSDPHKLGLGLTTVTLVEPLQAAPRYNGAPGQDHWVIRQNPKSGERSLDRLRWGLIPLWVQEANGGRKPINARCEDVARLPSFRDGYAKRRCLLPVDSFFEWRSTKGERAKQPHAIGMKSGEPFALAAIWENWHVPRTDDWLRTFCVLTCPANALIADIHDRMPVIIPPAAYDRWLANIEPDPRDLLVPFAPEHMIVWPVGPQVNRAENDDPEILRAIATG
jgi:putative SOS response-associated peptidase YedK